MKTGLVYSADTSNTTININPHPTPPLENESFSLWGYKARLKNIL
jgi:hypothetical protein